MNVAAVKPTRKEYLANQRSHKSLTSDDFRLRSNVHDDTQLPGRDWIQSWELPEAPCRQRERRHATAVEFKPLCVHDGASAADAVWSSFNTHARPPFTLRSVETCAGHEDTHFKWLFERVVTLSQGKLRFPELRFPRPQPHLLHRAATHELLLQGLTRLTTLPCHLPLLTHIFTKYNYK